MMISLNTLGPYFFVPRNIMCSRKWAMPVRPGCSSRLPTAYQIFMTTMGALWSGSSRARMPFFILCSVTFQGTRRAVASVLASALMEGAARRRKIQAPISSARSLFVFRMNSSSWWRRS